MPYLISADLPRETAGSRFRALLDTPGILQLPGAHNGHAAIQAKNAGFDALYLSGAAMTASMGLPDLGVITVDEVAFFIRQIARASGLPLLVDGDTGYGEALNVMHMVRTFEEAGAGAVHLEDQQGISWYPYWGPKNKKAADKVFALQELAGKVAFGLDDTRNTVPTLTKADFNHKDGFDKGFINPSKAFLDQSQVFGTAGQQQELEQIGVYKNYRNLAAREDQGFFKFQYRRLDRDFAFCCYVEIDPQTEIAFKSCRVTMGKERSLFQLEVESADAADFPGNPTVRAGDQVHLLSDTYVDSGIYQYCSAAITETIPFRNLRYTLQSDQNYATTPKKSAKVLLLRRGSILCIRTSDDAAQQAQKLLDEAKAYQAIGYNYYRTN